MPIYNVERYLEKCLSSIIDQTYPTIEVILVNDASTDNCREICEKYVQKDSRLKLINLFQNSGLSNARNVGIENSSGEYLTFVDSDDWIEKDFVTDLISLAKSHQSDLVFSSYYRFDDSTGIFQFPHSKF